MPRAFAKKLRQNDLQLLQRRRVRTCRTAKDHHVGNGIAAQAVRAMNAARDLTGGVETRNHLAVNADNLRLGVDFQAAHRVMHRRDFAAGIPRAARQSLVVLVIGYEAERILSLAFHDGVVARNARLELLGIHAVFLASSSSVGAATTDPSASMLRMVAPLASTQSSLG